MDKGHCQDVVYDFVKFENVQIIYDKDEKIFVEFFLDPQMKGSTRDWIGIYPIGWTTFESFIAYQWGLGQRINNSSRNRRVTFDPKDLSLIEPNRHYQFVYVSQKLEIMGVSQFFSFCCTEQKVSPKKDGKAYDMDHVTQCRIHLPHDLDNVVTVCSKCKPLFDLIDHHKKLKIKAETYAEKISELESRIKKLESLLGKTASDDINWWNEELERMQFFNFINELRSQIMSESKDDVNELLLDTVSQKELALKAIVGSQEFKIRELTKLINLNQHEVFHAKPIMIEDTVKVVKVDEKLLPEEIHVNNDSED